MAASLVTLELIARGIAIGALLAMAAGFVFAGLRQPARLAGLMFTLGVIAYVLNSSPIIHEALRTLRALDWAIHFFSLGGVGLSWRMTPTSIGRTGSCMTRGYFGCFTAATTRA